MYINSQQMQIMLC